MLCTQHGKLGPAMLLYFLGIAFRCLRSNLHQTGLSLEKISTIRTNNTTSYMRPILQQYAPIRLPGSSAEVTYTSKEPTVFTAP